MGSPWPDHPSEPSAPPDAAWPDHPSESAQPPPALQPPIPPSNALYRTMYGVTDPARGGAQLLGHLGVPAPTFGSPEFGGTSLDAPDNAPPVTPPAQTQAAQQAEAKAYEDQRKASGSTGMDVARLAGNLISPLNFLGGGSGGLATRLATGAAGGAGTAALAPVQEDNNSNYWLTKARDVSLGAGLGSAAGAVSPFLSWLRGGPSADQQLLGNAGVTLSPGAGGGVLAKGIEDTLGSTTLTRGFVQGDRTKMLDSFNLALHNDVLSSIGKEVPKGTAPGHDAFNYTMGAFNDAYDKLLPQVSFTPGQAFNTAMVPIWKDIQLLPQAQQEQFTKLIQQKLADPLQQNGGVMTGDMMKTAETDLRQFGDKFSGAGGSDGLLGDAVNNVRRAMRTQLTNDYPALAPELTAIDRGYARLATVKGAGLAATSQGGVFTPAQLLNAIRNDANPNAVLKGGAPLQDVADAAQRVIGSNRVVGSRPASLMDNLVADIIGSRFGVGAALGGAGYGLGATTGLVDPTTAAALGVGLAIPNTRRVGNAVFGPGGVARSAVARTPQGLPLAVPGLLNAGPQQ
jgi:hypothetical protein